MKGDVCKVCGGTEGDDTEEMRCDCCSSCGRKHDDSFMPFQGNEEEGEPPTVWLCRSCGTEEAFPDEK